MMLLPLVILMEVVLHSIVPKEKLLNTNDVSIARLIGPILVWRFEDTLLLI